MHCDLRCPAVSQIAFLGHCHIDRCCFPSFGPAFLIGRRSDLCNAFLPARPDPAENRLEHLFCLFTVCSQFGTTGTCVLPKTRYTPRIPTQPAETPETLAAQRFRAFFDFFIPGPKRRKSQNVRKWQLHKTPRAPWVFVPPKKTRYSALQQKPSNTKALRPCNACNAFFYKSYENGCS